jgi:hypothetical protein
VASDGDVYYILSSSSIDQGGQMYRYSPTNDEITQLGDLTEIAGEAGLTAIPQGKCHVQFHEADGRLYFASHVSHYSIRDGRETMGTPPAGYRPYPGGHFLAYDIHAHQFQDLATVSGQGIITMAMDARRGRLYGITWPNGIVVGHDLDTKRTKFISAFGDGEAGDAQTRQNVCRSMVVNPKDGSAYFTTSDGTIVRYRWARNELEPIQGDSLRKDYFGAHGSGSAEVVSYQWRQAFWHPVENVVYAVHGPSGYLFRFDPDAERVDVLDRLAADPSRKSGMFDKHRQGYLGFTLGPDRHTIYYWTGGAIRETGRLERRYELSVGDEIRENIHLVTFDILTSTRCDHGALAFEDGQLPESIQSIAVGPDQAVYALVTFRDGPRERTDLLRTEVAA